MIAGIDKSDWDFLNDLNDYIEMLEAGGCRVRRLALPRKPFERFERIAYFTAWERPPRGFLPLFFTHRKRLLQHKRQVQIVLQGTTTPRSQ